jgi:exo-beta-1,3-glucanase (GH17 family)
MVVVFFYVNTIPTSWAPMYMYYSPERMRGAVRLADFPAGCSSPVDQAWAAKVSSIRWVAYGSPAVTADQASYQLAVASIYKDLSVLKKAGFSGLVTYGSAGIMGRAFPAIAQSLGYQGLIMGIWNPSNRNELNNARNASELPILMGYGIGNEGLYANRERYNIPELCSAISDLRAATGKPVATSEEIDDYSVHPELLFVGDWLFPNAHPYWHSTKYPQAAVEWQVTRYRDMVEGTQRFVFFKEVGLPTSGAYGLSEQNHDLYYRELAKTDVRFVYFEGFDQLSKTGSLVEPYWGVFAASRKPKLLAWNLMGYRLFTSSGVNDGAIRECPEAGGSGCQVESTSDLMLVGSDSSNREYRGFLSFNTSSLPDDAVVTSARLKLKLESYAGNPFSRRRQLRVDLCSTLSAELQPADFQSAENCIVAGIFVDKPLHGWYITDLDPSALAQVNLSGSTQFRLRYNEVTSVDYIRFYSGDAPDADKPTLTLRYSIP